MPSHALVPLEASFALCPPTLSAQMATLAALKHFLKLTMAYSGRPSGCARSKDELLLLGDEFGLIYRWRP